VSQITVSELSLEPSEPETAVLEIEHLALARRAGDDDVLLVSDVSISVGPGETVGVVGESGCGKSLSALAALQLLPESVRQVAGRVVFQGQDLTELNEKQLRALRGSEIAAIFQDPQNSLNPAFTIGNHMVECLRTKQPSLSRHAARKRAIELLDRVGIVAAEQRLRAYPHEFSGGMAQRVMIALAIANDPTLLIADEPTTALDVTVQQQILDLLTDLQREDGLSIVLISHDLAVVGSVAHRVAVLYAGETIEEGPTARVLNHPWHPYTRALLLAQPSTAGKGIDSIVFAVDLSFDSTTRLDAKRLHGNITSIIREGEPKMDVVFLLLTAGLAALSLGLIVVCNSLMGEKS